MGLLREVDERDQRLEPIGTHAAVSPVLAARGTLANAAIQAR